VRRARDGFLLVEVVVSLAVTTLLFGGVLAFLRSGIHGSRVTTVRALLDRDANHALRQMVEALLPAGASTLSSADAPLGSSFIDFRVPAWIPATGIVWGRVTRIELTPDPGDPVDGVDNDGDGLIDERQVVIRRDFGGPSEIDTILVRDVASLLTGETKNGVDDNGNGLQDEPGLVFERLTDGSVRIRLTLQAFEQNTMFERTVEATVLPRN